MNTFIVIYLAIGLIVGAMMKSSWKKKEAKELQHKVDIGMDAKEKKEHWLSSVLIFAMLTLFWALIFVYALTIGRKTNARD